MKKEHPLSIDLETNITNFKALFAPCTDIKMCKIRLGESFEYEGFYVYIEVTGKNLVLEKEYISMALSVLHRMDQQSIGVTDSQAFTTMEEVELALFSGDTILFVDGFAKAVKIPAKGYPGRGVFSTEAEKVVRGSNEGFTDSVKLNTALLRKRLRTSKMKVEELRLGVRSKTLINLVYINDLVDPFLLREVRKRLTRYEIDNVAESGVLEQLAEEKWYSPFPQFQTTERPDRSIEALLEGRVLILCDNTPVSLILPTDWNSFLKTPDDYYMRWEAATFARFIRYGAALLAVLLPGFYLMATNFHTQILPTPLLLAFAKAREGVPFPAVLELLLMEGAFELLREAGIRLPGVMGSTIGIVGGLIIGQAAVEAGIVSPVVVIVVAFTALCSFAVPNEEFSHGLRMSKYIVIAACAWLGYFGFLLSICGILLHLTSLHSFGIPYLTPWVEPEPEEKKDALFRYPLRLLNKRPFYAQKKQRVKLKKRGVSCSQKMKE